MQDVIEKLEKIRERVQGRWSYWRAYERGYSFLARALPGVRYLGSGSFRDVFLVGDTVVKLPKGSCGKVSNRREFQMWNAASESERRYLVPIKGFVDGIIYMEYASPLVGEQDCDVILGMEAALLGLAEGLFGEGIEVDISQNNLSSDMRLLDYGCYQP